MFIVIFWIDLLRRVLPFLYRYGYCGDLNIKKLPISPTFYGVVLFSHKGWLVFIKLQLALAACYSSFCHSGDAILAFAILAPSCQGDMLWAAEALANSEMKPNYGCKTLLSCMWLCAMGQNHIKGLLSPVTILVDRNKYQNFSLWGDIEHLLFVQSKIMNIPRQKWKNLLGGIVRVYWDISRYGRLGLCIPTCLISKGGFLPRKQCTPI